MLASERFRILKDGVTSSADHRVNSDTTGTAMKIRRHDGQIALEWGFRFGVPVVAWAAVLAFFLFAGSGSDQETPQSGATAQVVPLFDDGMAPAPLLMLNASGMPQAPLMQPGRHD